MFNKNQIEFQNGSKVRVAVGGRRSGKNVAALAWYGLNGGQNIWDNYLGPDARKRGIPPYVVDKIGRGPRWMAVRSI